jgi:hypothetical protein
VKEQKYPRNKDIKEHKDAVFTSMVQYFGGYVPLQNIEMTIRSLMGDAALWVHNNHKELDLENIKKQIAGLTFREVKTTDTICNDECLKNGSKRIKPTYRRCMFCGAKHRNNSPIQKRHDKYIQEGMALPPYSS